MIEDLGVAVVYHWWDMTDTPIHRSSSPVIPAIASLRAVNNKVPIYVLDSSGFNRNWQGFPEKYDFYVVKWPFEVRNFMDMGNDINDMSLSVMLDVWKFSKEMLKEGIIVYCDTDTFWFEDALPTEYISTNQVSLGANNGIMCYNKHEAKVERFFDLYKAYTVTALHNESFFKTVVSLAGGSRISKNPILNRTNMFAAMLKERPYWFSPLPNRYAAGWQLGDVASPKMVHVGDLRMQNRGDALVLFRELFDNIENADLLSELDWVDIYGSLRFAKLREWQTSIGDSVLRQQLKNKADLRTAMERVHRTTIKTI